MVRIAAAANAPASAAIPATMGAVVQEHYGRGEVHRVDKITLPVMAMTRCSSALPTAQTH